MTNQFNLTDENVVNYDEKLHPETGALSDEALNCVSGGNAMSGCSRWLCKDCLRSRASHVRGLVRCGLREYTCINCKGSKNGNCIKG